MTQRAKRLVREWARDKRRDTAFDLEFEKDYFEHCCRSGSLPPKLKSARQQGLRKLEAELSTIDEILKEVGR